MNEFRSLMVSFAVLFGLMFWFGASVQAAELLEQTNIAGPSTFQGAPPGIACVGEVVGRATIEKKGEDLAQTIVGAVTGIKKTDESITVTVRFRNGPPNVPRIVVRWRSLNVPGDCASVLAGNWGPVLGIMSTDAEGSARARFILPENPQAGLGVKLTFCIPNPPTPCGPGDTAYWALFKEVF